jgi:hypothetical protein
VFNTGVQAVELRQVVEHGVLEVVHGLLQLFFNLNDIHQVAVLVQLGCLQPDLDYIVVGVWIVFGTPVPTDQKVLRNQVLSD